MKLGRDFTNMLYFRYLGGGERKRLEEGTFTVPDMDATVQLAAKKDIIGQVQVAKELGLDHVELDGAVPNPYLSFTQEEKEAAGTAAKKAGIALSLHLPYTYVAGSFCAPHEDDRERAVELMKRYVDFASEIGCEYVNAHPGVVPFYHATGKYLELIRQSLLKSTIELGAYAKSRKVTLVLENNTAFDGAFYEPDDLCRVVEEARSQGVEVYFNFDIGHWFTRADVGLQIPNPPEKIMEEIPDGMFKELHLNDYVPGKRLFHPPLHEGVGLLKRENLRRYMEIVRKKGAELIVLETAIKTKEQVLESSEILKRETEFLREILG